MRTKLQSLFFFCLAFVLLVNSLVVVTNAAEGDYWIDLSLSPESYVLRGQVLSITVNGNFSTCTVEFWYEGQFFADYTHTANTTRDFTIQPNYPYGTYTIKAIVGETVTSTWITVLKVDGWQQATFPYQRSHNGVDYTFFVNGTIKAENNEDELVLDLSMLRSLVNLYDLDVTATYNEMNFRVNFQKEGIANINFVFSFIHTGCKFIVDGELDQAREFSFNIKNPSRLKKLVDGVKQGSLVFDFSDLRKAAYVFSYNNGILTLSLPQTFSFDPTIFSDGFENGYNNWDSTTESGSATLDINQTIVQSGVNSSKYIGDDSNGNAYCRKNIDFSSYPYIFYNVSFYVESYNGHYYCDIGGPYRFSTGGGILRIDGGYVLELHWKDTSYVEHNIDLFTPSTGQWYVIGVAFYYHSSAGNYTVWVNGVENVSDTGLDTMIGGEYPNYFDWGIKAGYSADVYFLDDILLTDEIPTGGPSPVNISGTFEETAVVTDLLSYAKAIGSAFEESGTVTDLGLYSKALRFESQAVVAGADSKSWIKQIYIVSENSFVVSEIVENNKQVSVTTLATITDDANPTDFMEVSKALGLTSWDINGPESLFHLTKGLGLTSYDSATATDLMLLNKALGLTSSETIIVGWLMEYSKSLGLIQVETEQFDIAYPSATVHLDIFGELIEILFGDLAFVSLFIASLLFSIFAVFRPTKFSALWSTIAFVFWFALAQITPYVFMDDPPFIFLAWLWYMLGVVFEVLGVVFTLTTLRADRQGQDLVV